MGRILKVALRHMEASRGDENQDAVQVAARSEDRATLEQGLFVSEILVGIHTASGAFGGGVRVGKSLRRRLERRRGREIRM